MSFLGHMENGKVVFNAPVPLPDGTSVRVEAIDATDSFWHPLSLDELAVRQGVPEPASVDDLVGGWPIDQRDDDFESHWRQWREQERDNRR